jgi:hypothetical protein
MERGFEYYSFGRPVETHMPVTEFTFPDLHLTSLETVQIPASS